MNGMQETPDAIEAPKTQQVLDINNVTSQIQNNGIGQRMLDKIISEDYLFDIEAKEGTTVEDCTFLIESNLVHSEVYGRFFLKEISIVINYPGSDGKMYSENFKVGTDNGEGLTFDESFGASGDTPLNQQQRDYIKSYLSYTEEKGKLMDERGDRWDELRKDIEKGEGIDI